MTTALPSPDASKLDIRPFVDEAVLKDFDCGKEEVNGSIHQCFEWHGINRVRIFCAHFGDTPEAYGFYAASIAAPKPDNIDGEDVARHSEGRSYVPFIYLNYLGVRKEFQRQDIGTALMGHFLQRCIYMVQCIGVFGIALHALTEEAMKMYYSYGFRCRNDQKAPLMILPTQTILDLLKLPPAASTPSTPAKPGAPSSPPSPA